MQECEVISGRHLKVHASPKFVQPSNLFLRIMAAVVFIPLYLFSIYADGLVLFLINLAIVLVATYEFLTLDGSRRHLELWLTLMFAGLTHYFMHLGKIGVAASIAVVPFLMILFLRIIRGAPRGTMMQASKASVSVIYISWLFGHIYLLRGQTDSIASWGIAGWKLAIVPFVITWIVDTAAYGFGRAMGKMPLAPAVSPKKTWEGAIAGFIAGIVAGALASLVGLVGLNAGIAIGAFVGSVVQLGDLGESLLKREADVKDSSSLIPGHGGVLDRFDSLLLNIPGTYYLLVLMAPG